MYIQVKTWTPTNTPAVVYFRFDLVVDCAFFVFLVRLTSLMASLNLKNMHMKEKKNKVVWLLLFFGVLQKFTKKTTTAKNTNTPKRHSAIENQLICLNVRQQIFQPTKQKIK